MTVSPRETRWTVRRRAQTTVAALVLLLVGTGVVVVVALHELDAADEAVSDRWMPALVALERLQSAYLDEQTGVRGYVLTGQQQLMAPFHMARDVAPVQEGVLRTALAADEHASTQLDAVVTAHAGWLTGNVQPQIDRVDAGMLVEAQQVAAAGATGPIRFDAVRGAVDALRTTLESSVAAASGEVARVRAAVQIVLLGAAGVGLLLAAMLLVGLRRAVIWPLERLGELVTSVASGHLDRPVAVVGPIEVTTVAVAVERMREALRQHASDEAGRAELEGRLLESERIAVQLQEDVVNRLFTAGVNALSIANAAPEAGAALRALVAELDAIGRELRMVALGLAPSRRP